MIVVIDFNEIERELLLLLQEAVDYKVLSYITEITRD